MIREHSKAQPASLGMSESACTAWQESARHQHATEWVHKTARGQHKRNRKQGQSKEFVNKAARVRIGGWQNGSIEASHTLSTKRADARLVCLPGAGSVGRSGQLETGQCW